MCAYMLVKTELMRAYISVPCSVFGVGNGRHISGDMFHTMSLIGILASDVCLNLLHHLKYYLVQQAEGCQYTHKPVFISTSLFTLGTFLLTVIVEESASTMFYKITRESNPCSTL